MEGAGKHVIEKHLILDEKKNGIATITMDRPKKRNAMIPSMIIDMIDI